MILLKSIHLKHQGEKAYPYHLPFFNQDILFKSPVTLLIGDNGSGKSTLLEILRAKLNLFKIGQKDEAFLNINLKASYHLHKPRGFYFSSEDFTTYIDNLEKEKAWSKQEIKNIEDQYKNRSDYAKSLAKMPHNRTLHEIDHLHDRNLNESSHGEAYLSFFKSRMRDHELILLDEPETPLSFENQLALLYIIKEGVEKGSQFIIATHSPVMMAYPQATIYQLSSDGLIETSYEKIEQVESLKQFLNHPDHFLRHLFK
ncbi:MAG: ABC transporter ATP-binding protein [Tenericutes bacterium HGW-Tenericutes-6]|nr:MAG: ABC transporter ATP-binding protein [Tenericutes bacterium HGW-Tenericutes-6]